MLSSHAACKSNSAMTPGPDPTKLPATPQVPPKPGPVFREKPIWICSLCHKPVLDDKGKPKYARAFRATASRKEPANWYHCEACRGLSRKDKNKMVLLASAKGTTPINKMFGVARAW